MGIPSIPVTYGMYSKVCCVVVDIVRGGEMLFVEQ